ncbi:YeeE/YedE family protein [Yoonia sp. 2307UL14-13]|uniref:YeeE/YedE family protein n=1 Tax=Yoonia sp. 2307UL14-13 TaxID=3126506 RepID=UPI0030B22AF1
MQTDWLLSLAGGGLIGIAAAIFLLVNGRIMGASGVLGGLVDGSGRGDWAERAALLVGLVVAPSIIFAITRHGATHLTENIPLIITAGLCVGFGTRLANGCTSGHGVCGISRLSLRGLVATGIYVMAGIGTVTLLRTFWGII